MAAAVFGEIAGALWSPGLSARTSVFALVDAARDEKIFGAVDATYQPKECLYAGDLPWQLQMTAPYLVELARDERFTRFFIENGWGNSWGLFLRTETGFKQLRRHLRQFLRVRTEDGKRLIFRYYDPRILRAYLPTCRPGELETFFGPVSAFLAESEDPAHLVEFRRDANHLSSNQIELKITV